MSPGSAELINRRLESLRDRGRELADSPPASRARMLAAAPLAAARRESSTRAIARALASTAAARTAPAERAWIARIEQRRAELGARQTQTRAGYAPDPDLPAWVSAFDQTVPLAGTSVILSIPAVWGQLLLALVRELRPVSCLELGTAFGISACYQAAALELNGRGRLLTLDGARRWGAIAGEGFERLRLAHRVQIRLGQIDRTLPGAVEEAAPIDYAFLDAEHQAKPTLDYFEAMIPSLADPAVVVFDDIRFPKEMREAWTAIKAHPRVRSAIGLGRLGIVAVAGETGGSIATPAGG